jgi:site-specific DNA recombinase
MLKDGAAGLFTHVVAVDVDRLLRSISDLARVFEVPGMRVVTVDGEIDTASADGEFRATMLAALARFEVRRKAERAHRRNDARRARGIPSSGRPPFGFRWVPAHARGADGMPWAPVPEDLALVAEAYGRALAGEALGSLTASMNARTGRRWTRTTVRRMLLSPVYVGLLPTPDRSANAPHYDPANIDVAACVPGAWEPIVGRSEWDAVRYKLLDSGRSTHEGSRARKWLLGGLAICGVCGEPVRTCVTREGHRGYRCRGMAHFIRRGDAIDAYVVREVIRQLSRPEVLAVLRPDDDSAEMRAEAHALRARLADLATAYATDRITLDQMTDATAGLRSRLRAVEARATKQETGSLLGTAAVAADMPLAWADLPLATKREVINVLARKIVIDPVGKGRGRGEVSDTVRIEWVGTE